jgi:hypothetical protein
MATTAYAVKVRLFGEKQSAFLNLGPPLGLNRLKVHATRFTDKGRATATAAELLASNLGTVESTEVVEL